MAEGLTAKSFREGIELVEPDGFIIARRKRALSKCVDGPREVSPKRPRLSARNPTTSDLAGSNRRKKSLRDSDNEGASMEQCLKELVHSLVSQAVFSLDGKTDISTIMDTFQSAMEKKIGSGAIHVQPKASCEKINDLGELKDHIKSTLTSTVKPSVGLAELGLKLGSLKREAAGWAELNGNKDDLVAVLPEKEDQQGALEGSTAGGCEKDELSNGGMQAFERLAEIGRAVELKEMELMQVQQCTEVATLQAKETSRKLLEMRNQKFYALLPDQKPIDMIKTLLEI